MNPEAADGGGVPLCRLEEIADGGGRDFVLGEGSEQKRVFVLRRGEGFVAYVNSCPHVGTPLNMLPGRFLDRAGRQILCVTHGARFRIADGFCTAGPCQGKSLTPAPVELRRGALVYRG